MSGSPRKQLLRADDALQQLLQTVERYPEARADFVARLGKDRYLELEKAAETVRQAVEAIEARERADDSSER